ncbi:zn-finger domain-containing protein [Gigaspora margarita]|uniref:Zn-finger domain-containing protein n=1 Tax=Gigaspora margarita TaxID=4874 RepID=A0A8H4AJN0_GIGMA|nr:zn-finger domain-containing protein [Gigaspora margarita]
MNIYEATVIDRMHHLDLGLFKHQINFTCSLLKKKYRASILDTIDNRLANIPRFPELKIFKNSIQSLARITANEYRNLMKVMIFVLNNLDIDESIQNKLLKLYEDWNNIFSTETYESLHKDFVKIPYYLSNKQNIEDQIMKMVQRQAIASKLLSKNPKNSKTINSFKFINLIWIFDLNHAQKFIDQRLKNYRPNSKIYSGLEHLLKYLTIYFNNFYRKAWYSNLAVAMNSEELLEYLTDEGICYGQIYLLIKVETAEGNVDNLALIQWYDFKSTKKQYYYGCPRLKLTELYNIVNIEAIKNNIHIIPRFDKTNDFLVNKYIF